MNNTGENMNMKIMKSSSKHPFYLISTLLQDVFCGSSYCIARKVTLTWSFVSTLVN